MSHVPNDVDTLKQALKSLLQAWDEAALYVESLYQQLCSTKSIPSEEVVSCTIEAITAFSHAQGRFSARISETTIQKPATQQHILELLDEMETKEQLEDRVNKIKQSIWLFTQLQCLDEMAESDVKRQQMTAKELLDSEIAVEAFIEAGEKYDLAVELVTAPSQGKELYQLLSDKIGFATSYALKNGFLIFPEIFPETASAVEQAIEPPAIATTVPMAMEYPEFVATTGTEEVPDFMVDQDESTHLQNDEIKIFGKKLLKFSTSKFEQDIKRISPRISISAYLMSCINNYGMVSEEQLPLLFLKWPDRSNGTSSNNVQLAQMILQGLCQKGYLVGYTISKEEQQCYYALSSFGLEAFHRESSRRLLHSASRLKPIYRQTNEKVWVLEECEQPALIAAKLCALTTTQLLIEKKLKARLILDDWRMLQPLPHRILISPYSEASVALIAVLADGQIQESERNQIVETMAIYPDAIPIVVALSEELGQNWSQKLSSEERQFYFASSNGGAVFIGNQTGEDCFPIIFGSKVSLEEEEYDRDEAEPVASVNPVDGQTVNSETPDEFPIKGDSGELVEDVKVETVRDSLSVSSSLVGIEYNAYIEEEGIQTVVNKAMQMLEQSCLAESMLLLHSVADHSADVKLLRDKLSYALQDPLAKCEDPFSLVDTPINLYIQHVEILDDFLNAAIWLRIFFNPDHPNDYRLRYRWQLISEDKSSFILQACPLLKQLIGYFWTFIDRHQTGLKYCASQTAKIHEEMKSRFEQVRLQLENALNVFNTRNVKAKIGHSKAHQMVLELYGTSGVLTQMVRNAVEMPLSELRSICQSFTSADLETDNLDATIFPDDKKLEEFLDHYWESMTFKSSFGKNVVLLGNERKHQLSWLKETAIPMLDCYSCRFLMERHGLIEQIPPERVGAYRREASRLMSEALLDLHSLELQQEGQAGCACLKTAIQSLNNALSEEEDASEATYFYENLLLTKAIELDEHYIPILDQWKDPLFHIEGARLWERIVKHCELEKQGWEQAALQALQDYDVGRYKLIHQHYGHRFQSDFPSEAKVADIYRYVSRQITKYKEDFMTDVEIAQNYGQIPSKTVMDEYFRLADAAARHAEKTSNAGYYNRLLDSCRRSIQIGSLERMEATQVRLEELKSSILQIIEGEPGERDEDVWGRWPIIEKTNQMLKKRNITVAEDYIQLAKNGFGYSDVPSIQIATSDSFYQFLDRYQQLYVVCSSNKSEHLYGIYEKAVRSHQRNRNTANSDEFIRLWSRLPHPESVKAFVKHLSYREVADMNKIRDNEFNVIPEANDGTLGQYNHPFACFGTLAFRKGLRVIWMAGTRTANQVLDELVQHDMSNTAATIILLDYAFSLAERKQIAKSMKTRNIPITVVIIDRVMALFLAGYNQVERGNVLLQLALPFSNTQPYTQEGYVMPPEMFIGRTVELNKIRSLDGPVLIYGGRQLGKTALLLQAKNLDHRPEKGSYAIFVDLKGRNYRTAPLKISEELVLAGFLKRECSAWEELRTAIRKRLADTGQPVDKLLLLLDEADELLASCEQLDNRPLEIFKELRDSFHDRFKFVLAGLRNVVRFNKGILKENSVLAHLEHLTIRPLDFADACQLLQKPLHYLGFRIEEADDYMVSLILAKTNYYPGLIHFYCKKLIEAVAGSYKNGNYSDNSVPPYMLDERHLKTVLGHSDFLEKIEEKFRITLQLDTDDLYDILANAMAYHYYSEGIGRGASAGAILNICKEFEIGKVAVMSEDKIKALLEEMEELNILRLERVGAERYIFNRYSFFQMLGSEEDVFNQLIKHSEQGVI